MLIPSFSDYLSNLRILFGLWIKNNPPKIKRGAPFTYAEINMIIFFIIMNFRRVHKFKAQHRWLRQHPELLPLFGWETVPDRTTLSRRYKALYQVVRGFIRFFGIWAEDLSKVFQKTELFEDKSLFKACGPVWHRKNQIKGEIPEKLRNLDTDATWSKSEHHGWVYGYGIHLTVTESGFPTDAIVETASVSESAIIDQKADFIIERSPASVTTDNSYCKLSRIRSWAKSGIALVTPGKKLKEKKPEPAAYKNFIREPENQRLLKLRKTAVEPPFDLISKVLGLQNNQKQLPISKIANVRTFLALGVLIVQLAMVINNVWGLPLREISHIITVFI